MTSLAEVTLSPLQAIAINGSLRTNERVEALYRLLHGPLLQTIKSFKDIDCEATATDTWIKVLSHLGAFVMPETSGAWPALQAWVYRIATNGATTIAGGVIVNLGEKISRKTPSSPWEMLAQAMICSNEFVYLD